MTLTDRLHDLADALATLPPLRRQQARETLARFLANREHNLFHGVHETWAQAAEAARSYGTEGYDNGASTDLYVHRTRMDAHDYPSLYWIERSLHEGMTSVFDVGGNIGIKYLAFREQLSAWPGLRWQVQDVTAVVERGRVLAAERGDGAALSFTDRFEDGDGADLLFASGVLQYLPATLAELLQGYRQLPRRIVINTAAIHPQTAYFTVNSIGSAFCPYRVQTQAGLMRGLSALGYRVRATWINPDKPLALPLNPELSLAHYTGFCLDRAS